jgi:hypothetical protein
LTKRQLRIRVFAGALLTTSSMGAALCSDLASDSSTPGPIRIKRERQVQKAKPSGYHNGVGSPSREARDEYYLLVPEEPKTDDELARRKLEATQLPKILTVLKTGNFSKAQQMLKELAQSMPIDTQSRSLYERLARMCADRMDAEAWYRYDIKDMKHTSSARQPAAEPSQPAPPITTSSVHSLRKEAWLLLTAGSSAD